MAAVKFALLLAVLPLFVAAQSPVYGQCGGIGYTGPTTCAAGSTCTVSNAYYSQCLPGSSAPSSTSSPSTTSKPPTSTVSTSVPSSTVTGSFQLTGRVPTSGANAGLLTWPNIGIHFSFSGTTASVTFTNQISSSGFTMSVDGSAPVKTTSQNGTTVTLSTGTLAKGTHTVQIFRVSEAAEGTIVFAGASAIKTDGTLLSSSPSSRRIEFIGDSITAGYGADGILPCTESVLTENAGKTYAADIGAFFKADISVVAWSGKGVIRNYPTGSVDTSPIIPQLWLDVAASYSVNESYTFPAALAPHAVVLNIGTNDFAYLNYRDPITQSQYSTGIVNFVKTIRSKYPSAKIFMVSSVMLSDGYPAGQNQHSTQLAGLQDAKTALNDPNVFVTDLPAQGSDVGCDYHPLPAEHAQMAAILEPVMQSALGW